jgi:pimeloyl-ACP methyl ester carboxylesterase
MVTGMSLGGLTSIALTTTAPELVRRLVLVDVTPGVDRDKAAPIAQFIAGPESFESFDEILARTIEFNPTRSESSLRRGVLHNAVERDDGRWVWRYQRPRLVEQDEMDIPADFATLWDDVSEVRVPLMLVRGGAPGTVVGDEDVAELLRRQPAARVEVVDGAGHSIQGDRPLELAALLSEFAEA